MVNPPLDTVLPNKAQSDPDVEKVKILLENYREALSKKYVGSGDRQRAISSLQQATSVLVKSGSKEVWNVFLNFHREHKNDVCNEKNGLKGLFTIPNRKIQKQISFLFYIVRTIVDNHPRKLTQMEFLHAVFQGDTENKNIKGIQLWNCYRRTANIK